MIPIFAWLTIGAVANFYLNYKNAEQINMMLTSGYLGVITVILTGVLNHFIWPISLYLHIKSK